MLKARVMCSIQSNSLFHFSSTPSMVSDPFDSGKGRHNIITMCNELIKVVLVWWFVADGFMFFFHRCHSRLQHVWIHLHGRMRTRLISWSLLGAKPQRTQTLVHEHVNNIHDLTLNHNWYCWFPSLSNRSDAEKNLQKTDFRFSLVIRFLLWYEQKCDCRGLIGAFTGYRWESPVNSSPFQYWVNESCMGLTFLHSFKIHQDVSYLL